VVAESAGNSAGGGNQKNEGQNVLQLAIRSRFKFIYRPAGLGNRDAAAETALTASGNSLAINNPTPFYITVSRISRDGGKALNSKTVMLAPQSSQTVALSSAVNRGETLTVNNINDYGADVAVKVAIK
jgi:chaperone protein EcpD